jgi:S-DNA-T family DNA segregation ATPase FtsK/SpoIIIE
VRRSPTGLLPLGWLVQTLSHLAPPGGWVGATLILVCFSAGLGVVFPLSPAGVGLRYLLGAGGPLAVAWPAWAAWLVVRKSALPARRLLAAAVLSATWLVALALREDSLSSSASVGAGGVLGAALLDLLEAGFGRAGGLALLSIGAAVSLVVLVGFQRIFRVLTLVGMLGRQLVGSSAGWQQAVPVAPATRSRPQVLPSVTEPPLPAAEPVILGPGASQAPPTIQPEVSHAPWTAEKAEKTAPAQWQRPDATILAAATDGGAFSPAELKARARLIEETLLSFGVQARVVEVQQGPAITQFGLDPAPGVAVNRIVSRQHDLALRLGAPSLRVLAPVPGRPLVGLEVPNASVATVKLGDLINAPLFSRARLPIGIGMDVSGKPVIGDLARMPHLLVAGATGSGKSVAINSLITSLLVSKTPEEVQLVLVDPKQVEMSQYRGLPHLRLPVVTEMDKVVATLRWTVLEMERRYTRFSEVGARNIVAFNERFPDERLGYLVVVVDELADMMMTAAEDVERLICRLAQLGRAAGVHLVVATQRPSVDVLTGLIKANLPTRLAFAVSSQTDSRVILDHAGAERLLGRGDALYQAGDEMNPRRVQGAFASDDEIEAVCNHWRAQGASQHTLADEEELEKLARQEDPEEKLLAQARQLLAERDGEASPALLARKLKIGAAKAARIHQALVADEAAARATPPHE